MSYVKSHIIFYFKNWVCWVSVLVFSIVFHGNSIGQTITAATGGTGISADNAISGTFTSLTGPVITETAAGQISTGTIVFNAPSGWEFNTAQVVTGTVTLAPGLNGSTKLQLASTTATPTASTITFTVSQSSDNGGNRAGRITFSNIQVRPTSGILSGTKNITNSGGAIFSGISYGSLSLVVGATYEIAVETANDGSGSVVSAQNLEAGTSLEVFAVSRDESGNFLSNPVVDTWSILNGTPEVDNSDLSSSGGTASVTLSSNLVGSGQIQATLTGHSLSTPTGLISVIPAAANNLTFDTAPTTADTAGVLFSPQPVIKMVDIYGNTITDYSGETLTASLFTGTGTLQGTVSQAFASGVVTYSDLSHLVANNIKIKFEVSGFPSLLSNDITIHPDVPTALTFAVQPPNGAKGSELIPVPEVQVIDQYGNEIDTLGITIDLEKETGTNAVLANNSQTTNANGRAVFSGFQLNKTGTFTIRAVQNPAGLTQEISNSFVIQDAGSLTNFIIDTVSAASIGTGPIGDVVAGDSVFIKITAVDSRGYVMDANINVPGTDNPSFNGKAFLSIPGQTGIGFGDSTNSFVDGVLLDTLILETTGNFTMTASRGSIITSSNAFDVIPTLPSLQLSTISASPTSIVADGSTTTILEVQIIDTLGNLYSSSATETIAFTLSEGGGTLLSTITDNGDGTYEQTLQSPTTSGTETVGFTIDGNPADMEETVTYAPGGFTKFGVELVSVSDKTAGTAFDINIYAQDANDNTITSFNGNVNITSSKTASTGLGTFALSSGELLGHTVNLTESGAGDATITVINSASSQTGTTSAFTVLPDVLDITSCDIYTANRFIDYVSGSTDIFLQFKDQFGNNLLDDSEISSFSVDIVSPASPTGSLALFSPVGASLYSGTLSATGSAEVDSITATINGVNISDTVTVYLAEVNEWTSQGGGGSNPQKWSNAGNWTLGVPTSNQAVFIPSTPSGAATKFPQTDAGSPITVGFVEIDVGASLNIESGFTFTISENVSGSGTLIADNATVNIGGDITISNLNAAGSTVNLNGTDSQTISGSLVSGTLNITNTSNPVIVSSSGYVNAGTALNISSGATLTLNTGASMELYGSLTGAGTLNPGTSDILIGGDISLSNVDFSNSDVYLNGTAAQDVSVDLTYSNLYIQNTTATVTLSGNTTVNSTIDLSAASTLQVDGSLTANAIDATGATLGIAGNLDITTITSPPTTTIFNGTSDQTLSFLDSFNNLTVNKSSGDLLAEADVLVDGTLTMTTGDLVMGSGTNLLADTRVITSGRIRFQRIFSEEGWYAISSPVDNSESFSDFLGGVLTQGYTGSDLGALAADSLQPNVLWYDETYNPAIPADELPVTDMRRWRAPSNATDLITPGRGYFLYVFPNVPLDPDYGSIDLPDTIDVGDVGNENPFSSSEFDLNVTFTEATDQDLAFNGWNLVGNPFGATIDWDDASNWTKTNIDASIYVWDHTANSGFGDYLVWNGVYGSLGDGLIAPFQAFWVKTNALSPSLVLQDGIKTSGGTFYNVTNNQTQDSVKSKVDPPPVISISLSTDSLKKETFIMFSDEGSMGKDKYDAYLLEPFTNSYLELYTRMEDGTPVVINSLYRRFGIDLEIPLYVDGYMRGKSISEKITIKLDSTTNIPDSWEMTLIDQVTKQKTILNRTSEYSFSISSSSAKTRSKSGFSTQANRNGQSERFILKISPGEDSNGLPDEFGLSQNYPNPFNPSTKIDVQIPLQSVAQLKIYDILGREVATIVDRELTSGVHTFEWNTRGLATGIYISRLITSGGVFTKKMTLIK